MGELLGYLSLDLLSNKRIIIMTTKINYNQIKGAVLNVADKGFLASASGAVNAAALTAAIATGDKNIVITIPGDYSVDNTTPIILNTNGLTFTLSAGVNILPSVNTMILFQITGVNVTFDGGTITGDGTYPIDAANPAPLSAAGYFMAATGNANGTYATGRPTSLIEVYGVGMAERQNAVIKNVTIVNPNCAGVMFYYAVGGGCFNCKMKSSYANVFVAGFYLVAMYSCAYVNIDGNLFDGHVEGFSGGSTPANTFNDYVVAAALSNTRHITISNNRIMNQIDHGIYMSNDADHTTVIGNNITNAVTGSGHAIKVFGSCTVVGNTASIQRHGFNGRNTINSIISGNNFQTNIVSGTSSNNAGIYIDCSAGTADPLQNITIAGNTLVAAGRSPNGIYLFSDKVTATGAQNIIKNITISGNTISGNIGATVAEDPYASGIKLMQVIPTSGSKYFGENITISGNTIRSDYTATYFMQYGIFLSGIAGYLGYDGVNINDNVFSNFVSAGIYGNYKNSFIANNIFKAVTAVLLIKEVANSDTPSGENFFGKFSCATALDSGWYNISSETGATQGIDRDYNAALAGTYAYSGSRPYRHLVLIPTAPRAITTSNTAGVAWQIGHIVTVHNINSGATVSVAANTSKTFMCTGSNTFIEIY
jgi:parallel beta-helix repeat protein